MARRRFSEVADATEIYNGIVRGWKLQCDISGDEEVARVQVKPWSGFSLEGHSRATIGYVERTGLSGRGEAMDAFEELKDELKPLIDKFDNDDRDPLIDHIQNADWTKFHKDKYKDPSQFG